MLFKWFQVILKLFYDSSWKKSPTNPSGTITTLTRLSAARLRVWQFFIGSVRADPEWQIRTGRSVWWPDPEWLFNNESQPELDLELNFRFLFLTTFISISWSSLPDESGFVSGFLAGVMAEVSTVIRSFGRGETDEDEISAKAKKQKKTHYNLNYHFAKRIISNINESSRRNHFCKRPIKMAPIL